MQNVLLMVAFSLQSIKIIISAVPSAHDGNESAFQVMLLKQVVEKLNK